jgi:DNA-binding transcriptional LysR family regulator
MMELRQLRHFISIARHGNLHRAAEELHLSQQALSASIARLEQDIGATLLVRSARGVELSPFGEALMPRALTIVNEARFARSELQSMTDATQGHVRAGVGVFFAQDVFPESLMRFVADYPRVDITVMEASSADLYIALQRGELDFVVSTPAAEVEIPPQFESELLFETRDAVYVRHSHPLANRSSVTLRDLADYPWIMSARFGNHPARLENAYRTSGLAPPSQIIRTDSVALIGQVLQNSNTVSLLGHSPFPGRLLPALGALTAFEIDALAGPYRGVLVWRRGTLLPAAAQLMQMLRRSIQALQRPASTG